MWLGFVKELREFVAGMNIVEVVSGKILLKPDAKRRGIGGRPPKVSTVPFTPGELALLTNQSLPTLTKNSRSGCSAARP